MASVAATAASGVFHPPTLIAGDAYESLERLDSEGRTDWQPFLKDRTTRFEELDEASHEFLAQALTLAAIQRIPDGNRRERLRATFDSLERRQPPHYVLPDEIKRIVHLVDWQLPIAAARVRLTRSGAMALRW